MPGTRRRRPARMPAAEMSTSARPFVVLVTIGIGALLAIVIFAASRLAARTSPRPTAAPAAGTRTGQLPAHRPEQQDRAEAEAAMLWEKTSLWLKANRGNYDESLSKLTVVASQAVGTRYALEAEAEMRRLKLERRKSADDVIRQLEVLASPHILERTFDEAAAVYEGYSGPLASETWAARADAARQLRARQIEEASSAASPPSKPKPVPDPAARIDECMTGLAKLLLSDGSVAGLRFLSAQLTDPVLAAPSSGMAAVREIVSEAADTDARILDSFKAQCGRTGTVYLNAGPRTLTVNAVEDGVIKATQSAAGGAAGIGITFSLRDLSLREHLARMGDDSRPGVSLEKGLMALRSASKEHAKAFFDKLPDPLRSALMAELGAAPVEAGATSEHTDAPGSPVDPQALRAAILDRNKTVTPAELVITPGSDGSIREIRIVSPFLSDISPIADAGSVASVICSGADPNDNLSLDPVCILQDISPLRRVSMNSLNIALTSVKDLTPLRGAQLRSLNIRSTGVSDLGPLAGMPLERLNIRFNPVKSLTPLRGMRLRVLDAYGTEISDLSPIWRMPLESLDAGRTSVRTLVPLKEMPLHHLNLSGTRVFDFSQIRGMPLETLDLSDTQFRDTALLSGMPLRRLILARTNVGDLGGISGTRLEELDVAGTVIGNVSVLAGMPLRSLNLSGTRVNDLSPLSQSPLVSLNVSGTDIRDLEPLSGLQTLRSLNLNGTDVRILYPLIGLNIESLDIRGIRSKEKGVVRRLPLKHLWTDRDDEEAGMKMLRAIPTLKTLNGQPVNRW